MIELFGDIQEATVEALEPASGVLIGDRPVVHVEKMTCGGQRLEDAGGGSELVGQLGTESTGTECGCGARWRAVWNSRCKSCWVTCTYRKVMRMSLWPSNCIRAGRLTPKRTISEPVRGHGARAARTFGGTR